MGKSNRTKIIIVIVLAACLALAVCLLADLMGKRASSLRKPPALKISCGQSSISVNAQSYSWFHNGIVDGVGPKRLDEDGLLKELKVSYDEPIMLRFRTAPSFLRATYEDSRLEEPLEIAIDPEAPVLYLPKNVREYLTIRAVWTENDKIVGTADYSIKVTDINGDPAAAPDVDNYQPKYVKDSIILGGVRYYKVDRTVEVLPEGYAYAGIVSRAAEGNTDLEGCVYYTGKNSDSIYVYMEMSFCREESINGSYVYVMHHGWYYVPWVTSEGAQPSGEEEAEAAKKTFDLRRECKWMFGLDVREGLTVFISAFSPGFTTEGGEYYCDLVSGADGSASFSEFSSFYSRPASLDEIRRILDCYGLPEDMIAVCPFRDPYSSQITEMTEEQIMDMTEKLFGGRYKVLPYMQIDASDAAPSLQGLVYIWFDAAGSGGSEIDAAALEAAKGTEVIVPEFQGISFVFEETAQGDCIFLKQNGEKRPVIEAAFQILNAFFCDINGDGKPELCTTSAFGSGMIDLRLMVYDIANERSYKLSDRGQFDYILTERNGWLMVMKRAYEKTSSVGSDGLLVLRNGQLEMTALSGEERDAVRLMPSSPAEQQNKVTKWFDTHIRTDKEGGSWEEFNDQINVIKTVEGLDDIGFSIFDTDEYGLSLFMIKDEKKEMLFRGMAINAYFSDINGDGSPELCITRSNGSGLVIFFIEVCDIKTGKQYRLLDADYDHFLVEKDGALLVRKRRCMTLEPILQEGPLVLKDGALLIGADTDAAQEHEVSEAMKLAIKNDWAKWNAMDEKQRVISSKSPGCVWMNFKTWDEAVKVLGFSPWNPLESISWLEKKNYVGTDAEMAPGEGVMHAYLLWSGEKDGRVSFYMLEAGYAYEGVRVLIRATGPSQGAVAPTRKDNSTEIYDASEINLTSDGLDYSITVISNNGKAGRDAVVEKLIKQIPALEAPRYGGD